MTTKRTLTPILCTECEANPAEYTVIDGDETQHLCEPSLKDYLVDVVTNNEFTSFETEWPTDKTGQIKAIIRSV